jgi:hypothetical protein
VIEWLDDKNGEQGVKLNLLLVMISEWYLIQTAPYLEAVFEVTT